MNAVSRSAFSVALAQELMRNLANWYGSDNWNSDRFGPHRESFKDWVITQLNRLFLGRATIIKRGDIDRLILNVSGTQDFLEGFSSLYELLEDEYSKSMLVKVIAYRIMGYRKVKLPLNTSSYWSKREFARSLIKSRDTIRIVFHNWALDHYQLNKIGYPIELYSYGILVPFIIKQYEYDKRAPKIKAKAGDYVIDAGGCWGDTALYFAHTVGAQGRVYTFDFVPDNLQILHRNVSLNPQLAKRIEVVPKALWDRSGEEIAYSANGPGTSLNNNQQGALQVATVSIDDFVREEKLPRVDYIKMDIEGAELRALQGAEGTIRAFRPSLAISVYHKEDDLVVIPNYLDKLSVGYEFFLDHFSIYGEETVLFATPKVD